MSREYLKYTWIIESIIKEHDLRVSEIYRRTGYPRNLVDDCVYDLMQAGKVICRADSTLTWHCKCGCHKHAAVMHCVPCC